MILIHISVPILMYTAVVYYTVSVWTTIKLMQFLKYKKERDGNYQLNTPIAIYIYILCYNEPFFESSLYRINLYNKYYFK